MIPIVKALLMFMEKLSRHYPPLNRSPIWPIDIVPKRKHIFLWCIQILETDLLNGQ